MHCWQISDWLTSNIANGNDLGIVGIHAPTSRRRVYWNRTSPHNRWLSRTNIHPGPQPIAIASLFLMLVLVTATIPLPHDYHGHAVPGVKFCGRICDGKPIAICVRRWHSIDWFSSVSGWVRGGCVMSVSTFVCSTLHYYRCFVGGHSAKSGSLVHGGKIIQ